MKKFLLLFFLIQLSILQAQEAASPQPVYEKEPRWELGCMGGWMFSSKDGYSKMKNNFLFSPSISYLHKPNLHIELSANFLSSKLTYYSTSTAPERTIPYSQMYVTGGLVRFFNVNSPVLAPYSQATIGALYRSASSGTPSQWQFAVGLAFGLKYMMNEKYGFRSQIRLQSPVNGFGLGVGVGTGGVGAGVGTYGSFIQLDLSGGFFVRL